MKLLFSIFQCSAKNGLVALKELKIVKPKLPVLMLSIYSEGQYAVRVLQASASEELVKTVEKIYLGQKYITTSLAEKLADFSTRGDKLAHENLSKREFEVFKMIVSGKTFKEIAKELFISVKTVSTYKTRIYEKMNFESR